MQSKLLSKGIKLLADKSIVLKALKPKKLKVKQNLAFQKIEEFENTYSN